jgi:hypothetical protein
VKRVSEKEEQQPDIPVTYLQKKNMVKSVRKPTPTAEQVVMLQLRTGHNQFRSHMYTKFRKGISAMCICGQAPQTTKHILQDCPNYDAMRQIHWPRETPLEAKLYGTLCELQKTVKFIQ